MSSEGENVNCDVMFLNVFTLQPCSSLYLEDASQGKII